MSSSSDWWRKGFEANVTTIESLIKEELDINVNNYAYGHQLFISLITFLKSKSRNNNLDNNKSLILPTEAIKVNKSAKKKEDKASEVPHGTLTTWNGGISSTTNNLLLNNVNSGASYSSTKPSVDEEGRKKVNLSGLSKKRAHQEVMSIPLDFENLLFSVTNPISDHALLATPRNPVNEPAKKKKDEANELAKRKDEAKELEQKKKEEAIELAKKKKEEAIELAKKKKEEASELAKKKKEEAIELAKKKKEEAIELAKKKKEEAIELAKKKEEAIQLAKKKKEEAIELAKKKKAEAIELAKKKKEEDIELAKKKREEAILAKKKKEEAMELAKKKKEEANELAKKKKEAANELAKKKKDEANELAKKKKEEANELAKKKKDEASSSTKPKVNKEGSKLDNLVKPFSKKRAHKDVSTPQKNRKLLPTVTNPEADHAHVTTPTNLASLTNATQLNNIPGMSGLASSYYSNVGNITSSLAVKGVVDVVDDSTTKCPKDITRGDTTSLYGGISRKINSLFDKYVDLQPTGLSNYTDIDEEIAHPLSSKQPLMEISNSPWNDEKLLSSSNSTNVTDPKNLDFKASLHEVIPYVSIDELDTYEESKTCNFSQHLTQWSDDKVNSGTLQVWTGEHNKSFEDEHVWGLIEEPISDALQVYTGDDIKSIKNEHVWDLVEVEPISDSLPVYTGDDTKSIKDEHVWDLIEEEPKYGALQIYTGDETNSSKDEHPRKRAKRSASSSQSDVQSRSIVTSITLE